MSPLAAIIYDILRRRASLKEPRITYAELAEQVRDAGDEFEYVHHRNRQLYAALAEVGAECRRCRRWWCAPIQAGPARRIMRESPAASSTEASESLPGGEI